jgi:hypothetical protein
MKGHSDVSLIDHIVELAHEVIEECPTCTSRASEIIV